MAAPSPNSELARLMARFPWAGRIAWIGLRPAREAAVRIVDHAEAVEGKGLVGDRYTLSTGRPGSGKRGITLVQAEHLPAIATLSGRADVAPELLRRNVVVSGIALVALKDRRFRIGDDVVVEGTGPCDPCSRMEAALGEGGYNAMRGMGGICARIVHGGVLRVGDRVMALDS